MFIKAQRNPFPETETARMAFKLKALKACTERFKFSKNIFIIESEGLVSIFILQILIPAGWPILPHLPRQKTPLQSPLKRNAFFPCSCSCLDHRSI
jgi:hypothetical protein